jgi:hypothetical protein
MQLISSLNVAQIEYLSKDRFISYHREHPKVAKILKSRI